MSREVKPICVIKVDNKTNYLSPLYEIQQMMSDRFLDYHVIVVPFEQPEDEYFEPMQFQVFYEKDFTEIQYAELKEMIRQTIENQKNTNT